MMKTFKSVKLVTFLCIFSLLISMCSLFAVAVGNSAYGNIDNDRQPNAVTDVTVMSFNLMAGSDSTFLSAADRLDAAVKIITTYQPDILALQEVFSSTDNAGWLSDLTTRMQSLGYAYRALRDETGAPAIAQNNALITFYKSARFTFNSAATTFGALPAETTIVDADPNAAGRKIYFRSDDCYYHRLALNDTAHGNSLLYVFNTQLEEYATLGNLVDANGNPTGETVSIGDNLYTYTDPETGNETEVQGDNQTRINRLIHTQQTTALKTAIHQVINTAPCLVAGDFNTSFADSYQNSAMTVAFGTTENGLLQLYDNNTDNMFVNHETEENCYTYTGAIRDKLIPAARYALRTLFTDYELASDHIFVNSDFWDIAELRTVRDSVNGRRPSDHFPVLAHVSYSARGELSTTTFTEEINQDAGITIRHYDGDYDAIAGTYKDKSEQGDYTFRILPNALFDFSVTDQNGNAYPANGNYVTVQLTHTMNNFRIHYSLKGSDQIYDTVNATIHYTGADKPILQTENALNHYFADNAYQVVVDRNTDQIIIRVQGGTLYKDSACTLPAGTRLINIQPGRNTYYVKAALGNNQEVYELFVYKETARPLAHENVIYLEDDVGTAVGHVAFCDDRNGVVIAQAGKKIFSTLDAAAAVANQADGYILYMAPGTYAGNSVPFQKTVSFYGNNTAVNPNVRDEDGSWTLTDNRKEETVIDGALTVVYDAEPSPDHAKLTVNGLQFVDRGDKECFGSLIVRDFRKGWQNVAQRAEQCITEFDIRNNIFAGNGNTFNAAAIFANNSSKKTGVIINNYFKSTANRALLDVTPESHQYWTNHYYRGIFMRNLDGLTIDSNRFVDFDAYPIWVSSEIENNNTNTIGNLVYTVQYNRFEGCAAAHNAISNVQSGRADIRYYQNEFIRCGTIGGVALQFDLSESTAGNTQLNDAGYLDTIPSDYSRCSITVEGNDFYDCYRSLHLWRSAYTLDPDHPDQAALYEHNGDIKDLHLRINRNRFVNPTENDGTYTLPYNIHLAFFQTQEDMEDTTLSTPSVVNPNADPSSQSYVDWNFTRNYFSSPMLQTATGEKPADTLADGVLYVSDVHHPQYFYLNSISSYDPSMQDYINQRESFVWIDGNTEAFAPYYTDYEMTHLSDGSTDTATFTDIALLPTNEKTTLVDGIYQIPYDPIIHNQGIAVTTGVEGTIVSYSLEPLKSGESEADRIYNATMPTFATVSGPYTVYYKVEKVGYQTAYGSYTLSIIKNNDPRGSFADATVTYELNTVHQLSTDGITLYPNDTIVYTYNGTSFETMPVFTDPGTYEIGIQVTNSNFADYEDSAVLTVQMANLDQYTLSGAFDGSYTGEAHTVEITPQLPGDVAVEYSVNGSEYTTEVPSFTEPTDGIMEIRARAYGANYITKEFDPVLIRIIPATIDATVTPILSTETGLEQDLLTVDVAEATDEDKIYYSVDGRNFTEEKPTFRKAGIYQVAVKFTRPYHYDLLRIVTVNVAESTAINPLFTLSITEHLLQPPTSQGYVSGAERYTITWEMETALTDAGMQAFSGASFQINHYGIKYASSLEQLQQYQLLMLNSQNGDETDSAAKQEAAQLIADKKVIQYKYNEALVGNPVITMYRYNRYYVKNTKPLKARYAMFYISYTLDGVTYEEYSPISCTSTFLEGENSHDIISGYDETGEGAVLVPVN